MHQANVNTLYVVPIFLKIVVEIYQDQFFFFFAHQAFTNCVHGYNHACSVHADSITHAQAFMHNIDSSV